MAAATTTRQEGEATHALALIKSWYTNERGWSMADIFEGIPMPPNPATTPAPVMWEGSLDRMCVRLYEAEMHSARLRLQREQDLFASATTRAMNHVSDFRSRIREGLEGLVEGFSVAVAASSEQSPPYWTRFIQYLRPEELNANERVDAFNESIKAAVDLFAQHVRSTYPETYRVRWFDQATGMTPQFNVPVRGVHLAVFWGDSDASREAEERFVASAKRAADMHKHSVTAPPVAADAEPIVVEEGDEENEEEQREGEYEIM